MDYKEIVDKVYAAETYKEVYQTLCDNNLEEVLEDKGFYEPEYVAEYIADSIIRNGMEALRDCAELNLYGEVYKDTGLGYFENSTIEDVKKEVVDYLENESVKDVETPSIQEENIKSWYTHTYPEDNMGEELSDDATFSGLMEVLRDGDDVYTYIGASDSLIRERCFGELAERNGIDSDVLYNAWLNRGFDNEL